MPAHPAVCLLRLLCSCSAFYMPQYSRAYCVPAQPSICHNTAEPTMCLLSLLYATIQPSLLCACSAFYMSQYSRAYCVPAQPSICHNTAEPIMCLLSLLYATIQLSLLCACSAFYMPAQAAVCLLRLLYACSAFSLSHNTASALQHTCLNFPPGHNTLQCIATQVPQPC